MCLCVRSWYVLDVFFFRLRLTEFRVFVYSQTVCALSFSFLGWGWLSSVCWRVRSLYALESSWPSWSERLTEFCVFACSQSVRAWCFHFYIEVDWVPCVCVFAGRMSFMCSLLVWSKADRVPCVCVFAEGTCFVIFFSMLRLTEFHVCVCSQNVRAWCFPCWVDLRLTDVFACSQLVCAWCFLF